MKHLLIFFFYLLVHTVLLGQEGNDRTFLALKFTPTSLLNPNTGTLLTGIEIWPAKRFNIQYEYGHKLSVFSNRDLHPNKEDWLYSKHKFGARYHYFSHLVEGRWWRFGGLKLLPSNRRSFVGADLIYIPQSFIDLNGAVVLENGLPVSYTSALLHKNAFAATAVFGTQVPLGNKFFLEGYIGLGMKWMTVEHDLNFSVTSPIVGTSIWQAGGFSFDQEDGQVILPYLDLGIKIGFDVFHK